MKSASATAKLTAVSLAALAGACGAEPPAELAGLWSAGPAACEAGVGVRFEEGAIDAVYARERETLFAHPHYRQMGAGQDFRVRIEYQLPRQPGGAYSAGARGVITLARGKDGRLAPVAHNLMDERTGSARVRIGNDPALTALVLTPCAEEHPWREGLRGRG